VQKFAKAISLIFHPLIMPLVGVVFFFSKSPRYIPEPVMYVKVYAISLLTIVVPLLVFYLLKNRGIVATIYLSKVKERIVPLIIQCVLVLLILNKVTPANELIELYYFFLGILVSSMACLMLAFFKLKASIHMTAIGGVLMFFMSIGIHYQININGSLALLFVISGAIASSRWILKAHTPAELIIGFVVGFIPQLTMLNYWL